MGRPRVQNSHFRLVTEIDRITWDRLGVVCQKEHVSRQKLLRTLVESYLGGPVYRLVYKDPLLFENVDDPRDYPNATREAIGWVDDVNAEELRIIWDRPVKQVKGGKPPAGPSGLSIPKGCLVELRRLTSA